VKKEIRLSILCHIHFQQQYVFYWILLREKWVKLATLVFKEYKEYRFYFILHNIYMTRYFCFGSLYQGPIGITGPIGLTGPKGDKGDQGQKGDKGNQGDTGIQVYKWLQ
jgi:hypothetical protein